MTVETLSKKIVDASFNIFVNNYIEFCNSKIFEESAQNNEKLLKDLFVVENEVIHHSQAVAKNENCLDELDSVDKIIDSLFDSEENFIEQMNKDIDNFNKLYNCFKFGNLEDPGSKLHPNEGKKDGASGASGGGK